MTTVAVLFADGFEEIEAVAVVDVLRRAGLEVLMTGVAARQVTGAHQIAVTTDVLLKDLPPDLDAIVLPGGMPGSTNLAANPEVLKRVRACHAAGQTVAAICAAPLVLEAAGLTKGLRYTCFPGVEKKIANGTCTGRRVEVDGRIITACGPGAAIEFGLRLAAALGRGAEAAQLQQGMQVATAH